MVVLPHHKNLSVRTVFPPFLASELVVSLYLLDSLTENAPLPLTAQVEKMLISAKDAEGRDLLVTALHSGSAPLVCALVDLLDSYELGLTQRVQMVGSVNGRNQTSLMIAVQTGEQKIVQAVVKLVGDDWVPADDQVGMAADVTFVLPLCVVPKCANSEENARCFFVAVRA